MVGMKAEMEFEERIGVRVSTQNQIHHQNQNQNRNEKRIEIGIGIVIVIEIGIVIANEKRSEMRKKRIDEMKNEMIWGHGMNRALDLGKHLGLEGNVDAENNVEKRVENERRWSLQQKD